MPLRREIHFIFLHSRVLKSYWIFAISTLLHEFELNRLTSNVQYHLVLFNN